MNVARIIYGIWSDSNLWIHLYIIYLFTVFFSYISRWLFFGFSASKSTLLLSFLSLEFVTVAVNNALFYSRETEAKERNGRKGKKICDALLQYIAFETFHFMCGGISADSSQRLFCVRRLRLSPFFAFLRLPPPMPSRPTPSLVRRMRHAWR